MNPILIKGFLLSANTNFQLDKVKRRWRRGCGGEFTIPFFRQRKLRFQWSNIGKQRNKIYVEIWDCKIYLAEERDSNRNMEKSQILVIVRFYFWLSPTIVSIHLWDGSNLPPSYTKFKNLLLFRYKSNNTSVFKASFFSEPCVPINHINLCLTLFRMDLMGDDHGWWGGLKTGSIYRSIWNLAQLHLC